MVKKIRLNEAIDRTAPVTMLDDVSWVRSPSSTSVYEIHASLTRFKNVCITPSDKRLNPLVQES